MTSRTKAAGRNYARDKARSRWKNMIARCQDPRRKDYKYYGGRGITVCDRWQKFSDFYEDIGDPPNSRMQIDRLDNNKGYEPSNCCWATKKEQEANKRDRQQRQSTATTRIYDGTMELGIKQAAAQLGCSIHSLSRRLTEIHKKRGTTMFQVTDLLKHQNLFKNMHNATDMELALAFMRIRWGEDRS